MESKPGKVLIKHIDGCHNCPFISHLEKYDPNGDPMGFYCSHSSLRGNVDRLLATDKQAEENYYQIPIPNRCPLPDSGFAIEFHTKETDKNGKSYGEV